MDSACSASVQIEPKGMGKNHSNDNNSMMAEDECRVQIEVNYMVEDADTSGDLQCEQR